VESSEGAEALPGLR
jgi:hypothetical protein